MAAEDRLNGGGVHRALVIQLSPEGAPADITSWASVRSVLLLETRKFQGPNGPGACTSMAPLTAFHR